MKALLVRERRATMQKRAMAVGERDIVGDFYDGCNGYGVSAVFNSTVLWAEGIEKLWSELFDAPRDRE